MSPQDPQNAALLAHIVSQIEHNVNFLASQNYISNDDASTILTRLPNVDHNAGGVNGLTSRVADMGIGNRNIPPPMPRTVPTPPTVVQSRALWGYNENGQDPDDLAFAAGDIIEIVEETNDDWWTGRVNGKQGLFPSTYVERLAPAPASFGNAAVSEKKPYKPFGAAYHGMNPPPPPPPGEGVNSVGLQEKEATEPKKNKFGSSLARSAVGGVGFGAGAAVGGGLVRAIF